MIYLISCAMGARLSGGRPPKVRVAFTLASCETLRFWLERIVYSDSEKRNYTVILPVFINIAITKCKVSKFLEPIFPRLFFQVVTVLGVA